MVVVVLTECKLEVPCPLAVLPASGNEICFISLLSRYQSIVGWMRGVAEVRITLANSPACLQV